MEHYYDAPLDNARTPLTALSHIGPKRAEYLRAAGIQCCEQLAMFFPRTYLDCTTPVSAEDLTAGAKVFLCVAVMKPPASSYFRGMSRVSVAVQDTVSGKKLTLRWYNQPYRAKSITPGEVIYIHGIVDTKHKNSIISPFVFQEPQGLVPVYPTVAGLGQKLVGELIEQALTLCPPVEMLPEQVRNRYGLMGAAEALCVLHHPKTQEELKEARRRQSFDTALLYLIVMEKRRLGRRGLFRHGYAMRGVEERFVKRLPFAPTNAQLRAMRDIAADLARPYPMNRLLQGDVGSGKTAVAMFAMFAARENGLQSALMAPTELLGKQHYTALRDFFGDEVVLLTGGMKKAEREKKLTLIRTGRAKIIVGTHALFSNAVHFHSLGLVITDEQHRFGVEQRAKVADKGRDADVLVMSATPIPRTLALMLLADLDHSILDELPPGRQRISTSYIPQTKRLDMYHYVARQAELGKQTYAVCPFIDDSEDLPGVSATSLFEELKKLLPDTPIGLVHGRQKKAERDAEMERFRSGETRVLVTTTVIEVGVHVEQANIMIIESCDRFGLAQMHQLRGRVGRGKEKSYCFLLADNPGETAQERIETLAHSTDGFAIAEKDFALRGAGELIGTEQHGTGLWQSILGIGDSALLAAAREVASEALALPTIENNALIEQAERIYNMQEKRIALN